MKSPFGFDWGLRSAEECKRANGSSYDERRAWDRLRQLGFLELSAEEPYQDPDSSSVAYEMSYDEIAEELGISRERTRQLFQNGCEKAKKKLKTFYNSKGSR